MFGRFDEEALAAYAEKVRTKRAPAKQGCERLDNYGVGEHDHSFLDADEKPELLNHAEASDYDFGACVREGKL